MKPENFNGLKNTSTLKVKDFQKYYYGRAPSYKDAKLLRDEAQKKGFEESFIVSFNGDIKIDLQEALTLESKNKTE